VKITDAFSAYRSDVIVFRNQSFKTEEAHHIALKSLLLFLGNDIRIVELDFEMVRNWKLWMEARQLSALTVRGYLIKLRVVLGYMHLKGVDCLDPALIALPRRKEVIPQVLTPVEIAKLIESTNKVQNKCIISLLYSTGLRVSELCSLNRDDVKQEFFTVNGKGGKNRLCFIDKRSRKFINVALKARQDNDPALFLSPQNKRRMTPGNVQEIFKCARKRAGFTFPVHPHTMRHSFATNLMVNGCHVYSLQKMLGHANLQTTAQYLHLFDSELKDNFVKYHTT
jgi:site-specific recombinase XerD